MVRSKEEILASLRERFGDDSSDAVLAVLEDVSDTYDDLDTRAKGDGKDWKAEAERIDADWRKRYHDRFFSGEAVDEEEDPAPEEDKPSILSYDELFEEKE